MTGPADRVLASEGSPDDLSSNLQARYQTATTASLWRRHSRRGALALLLGTAAVLAVEQGAAFAVEPSSTSDAPASPAADSGGGDPPASDADAPPSDASASTATPASDSTAAAPSTAPITPKTYTVQTGDTMYSIARKHGVSVDAVLWANNLTDPNVIKLGQQLTIPPSTGKLHIVKDGDTLDTLATLYTVSKSGIAMVNGLADDAALKAGQRLLIPVVAKSTSGDPAFTPTQLSASSSSDPVPIDPNAASGSPTPPQMSMVASLLQTPSILSATGAPTVTVTNKKVPKLAWPIVVSPPKIGVSQGFRPGHTGIDIYAPTGTAIMAAAAGTVKMAEKDPVGFSGYGWIVIIDHGDGISTWYAHCSGFNVKAGDKVKAGDTVGLVGTTGRVTGPHLHFELRIGTTAVDPRLALP